MRSKRNLLGLTLLGLCMFSSGYVLAQAQADARREAFVKEFESAEVGMIRSGLIAQTSSSIEDYNAKMKGQPDPAPAYASALAKAVDDPGFTQVVIANRASSYYELKDSGRTLAEMSFLQAAQNARIIQLLKQQGGRKQ